MERRTLWLPIGLQLVMKPRSRRVQAYFALIIASLLVNFWLIRTPAMHGAAQFYETALLLQVFVLWPLLFFALVYPVTQKARHLLLPLSLGVLFGSLVLPTDWKHYWQHLDQLRWVLAAVLVLGELWVIALLLRSLSKLRGSERPEDVIREVVERQLGPGLVTRLIGIELMMWFYALLSWRSHGYRFDGDEFFSVHRHQGNADNQKGFLMLIGAEIPLAHGLLWFWNPTAALLVTALSVYGFVWLLGEYRATQLRPVSIDRDTLYLRYGLLGNERIPLRYIARVEPWNTPVARQRGVLRHKGGGIPNLRIELERPTAIERVFGSSEYQTLYIAVDDPARLIQALQAAMALRARELLLA